MTVTASARTFAIRVLAEWHQEAELLLLRGARVRGFLNLASCFSTHQFPRAAARTRAESPTLARPSPLGAGLGIAARNTFRSRRNGHATSLLARFGCMLSAF